MKKIQVHSKENFITKRREPFRFMLNLGIFGIGLMFFILTMIYLLRKDGIGWVNFQLPKVFWWSSLSILLSSYTLYQAEKALGKEQFLSYRILLSLTIFLGILFIGLQYIGWLAMQQIGMMLTNTLSAAFLYVISGLHVAHILVGLIFLCILWFEAFKHWRYVDSFVYSINPPNQLRLRLISYYWHFVDILWVYLFLFFLYHHG